MNTVECFECSKILYDIQKKTNQLWKGTTLCDNCWCKHYEERELLWNKIREYKPILCCICNVSRDDIHERFHYDHLNMFEKGDSICSMVHCGESIDNIYKEIDLCQIVCLPCHHLITDIENKIGFTRIKTSLTKKLNNDEIDEEEYKNQVKHYQIIYKMKMEGIYGQITSI